ncbi:DUF1758 domain-containing protein [Trichonephila clavipes]|nr:DUF1758 domain-containing protein [Trichonephila clavipes]
MPSIGGYHPYRLTSILTGLESNRACVGYAWPTNCSPSTPSHLLGLILDDLFKEFKRLDSTLSLEESELQEFEERYFYLNAKFNDKLDELNVRNQGRTQNSVHSQVSISNVEKFQYSKGLLTYEPASLIKRMPTSNDSYEEAWQKLFNSDECLRSLNSLGEQASSKDSWLIYLLLQKIDPESRRLWAIKSSEEFPNMKAFLDFLNMKCSSLEIMLNNESECKIPIRTNVKIFYNNSNESFICRALLDPGSECCFISERVVNILGLKRKSSKISLRGIAGVTDGQTKGYVDVAIGSQSSNERLEVNAFILNKVTSQMPSEFLDVKDLDYLKSIAFSDEEFMSHKECDIILGYDCFFDILRSGKIVGSKNEPIAQITMFGWVVAGKLNVKNKEPHELYPHFLSTENELNTDSLLQRFWETEELSVKKQILSDEEQFCENHFKSNFKYNDEGRFVVKLPIYGNTSRLGNTKGIAISRLFALERRFQVDKDFNGEWPLCVFVSGN